MQAAGEAAKTGLEVIDRARQALSGTPAAVASLVEEIALPALAAANECASGPLLYAWVCRALLALPAAWAAFLRTRGSAWLSAI